MKFHLIAVLLLFSLSFSSLKIFIRDYTYIAGETDSKLSSRQKAESEVKRLLLQELGMYILSVSVVENHVLTLDEIISVSAGLTKSKILDERWTGESYWIEMEIKADPEDIEKEVRKFVENNIKFERDRFTGKPAIKERDFDYGIPILIMGDSGKSYKGISLPGISGPGAFIDFSGIALGGAVGANATNEFIGLGIGLLNLSDYYRGLAIGGFNTGVTELTGVQIGAFNNIIPRNKGEKPGQRVTGLQIGLINKAGYLKGVQIGLFNTAENAWIPVMIGFNFAF